VGRKEDAGAKGGSCGHPSSRLCSPASEETTKQRIIRMSRERGKDSTSRREEFFKRLSVFLPHRRETALGLRMSHCGRHCPLGSVGKNHGDCENKASAFLCLGECAKIATALLEPRALLPIPTRRFSRTSARSSMCADLAIISFARSLGITGFTLKNTRRELFPLESLVRCVLNL
jgi:hypothetical protein